MTFARGSRSAVITVDGVAIASQNSAFIRLAMSRFASRAVRLLAPRAVAALLRKPDAPPSVDPLSAIPLARKSDPMSAIPLASPRDRDSLPPPPSVSPTPDDG